MLCHFASLQHFLGTKGSKGYMARLRRLFWQDESGFELGAVRTQAISDRPVYRVQAKRGKALKGFGRGGKRVYTQRVSVWGAMNIDGFIAFSCTTNFGTDEVCLKWFTEPLPYDAPIGAGKKFFELVKEAARSGETPIVFVDRLGAGGRAKENAIACHANPLIVNAAHAAGVGWRFLPAEGAKCSPIELAWDAWKARLLSRPPPGPPRFDQFNLQIMGPQSWDDFKVMCRAVVEEMNATPGLFRSFVHRHGLGETAEKRYGQTAEYQAALKAAKPYDIVKLALQSGANEHDCSVPKTSARAQGYARWWLANSLAGKVPKSPPPGPVSTPSMRGGFLSENKCRCCGIGKGRDGGGAENELVVCDKCPSAWHRDCLKTFKVTAVDWACPCCHYAPRRKPHPPVLAKPSGKAAASKAAAAAQQVNLLVSEDDGEDDGA